MNRVDELLGREVSMRSVDLLRVLVGPIVVMHLWPFLADARDGRIYRDAFYEPYASWYPELPRDAYVALLVVGAVAAIMMSLGVFARAASVVTFGVVAYNVFLSTTHYYHNRAFLLLLLATVAVARPGSGPAWPLWLLRMEVVVVYATSGITKLLDADWWGGTVTWDRVVRVEHRLVSDTPLPRWAIDVLTDRDFHTVVGKVAVLTELAIAAGVWLRYTRYGVVWLAVLFHALIEVSASVQVFSYAAIAALVIWAVPSTGDRVLRVDPASGRHRRLVALVRRLDWLGRFRIEMTRAPDAPIEVVDRDGSTVDGGRAAALVFSRLPLTAWFALPVRATWR